MVFFLRRTAGILPVILMLGIWIPIAQAQETIPRKIDDTELTALYALQVQNPDDTFLQKKIQDVREDIRNSIEDELNAVVAIPAEEEQIDSSGELSQALDRQKNTIRALEERLRERKVDLDLLNAEEAKFYLNPQDGTGAIAAFKTTKSYPHLLAKRAILTERISMLEGLIPLQNERLKRLIMDQRMQQFGSLIEFGIYACIFVVIVLFERLMRRYVLSRINSRTFRYSAIKFFSGGVYTLTFLWFFVVVYSQNPGILASFAIIGAGIAIAMQNVIKDIVGWVVIHQSRLFSHGDRISIGAKTGEVLDIGILHTKVLEIGIPPDGVLEQTGKILSIPNEKVLAEPVSNYNATSDLMKAEMTITITFESDWRRAEEILREILIQTTKEFAERDRLQHRMRTREMYLSYEPSNALVFKDIADNGVAFILRFTVPIGSRRPIVSKMTDTILERFNAEPQVTLAYKTTRYYTEGERIH
jgi:small-conductance mechanosensitive channel